MSFLERALPAGARVLEVGCGRGDVAAGLSQNGFRVRALDNDPGAVEAARARGVDAVLVDFLSYEDEPFDAVAFTRSLHHIQPLDAALDRTRGLLKPRGLLLSEEFAREAVDRQTARWFYETVELLEAADLIAPTEDLPSRSPDPLERWREDHMRERLNTGAAIRAAIAMRFELIESRGAPYLYRHFCGRLEEGERGVKVGRLLFETENRGIAEGRLTAAGLRLVATRP